MVGMGSLYFPVFSLGRELLKKEEGSANRADRLGIDPQEFRRRQGGIRGEPVVVVCIEREIEQCWDLWCGRLQGWAMERAKSYLKGEERDLLSLHPLLEGVPILPPPGSGDTSNTDLPFCPVPWVDPLLRQRVRADPLLVREGVKPLLDLCERLKGNPERLILLLFYSLLKRKGFFLPPELMNPPFLPVSYLYGFLLEEIGSLHFSSFLPPLFFSLLRASFAPFPPLPPSLDPLFRTTYEEAMKGRRTARQFQLLFHEKIEEELRKEEIEAGLEHRFADELIGDLLTASIKGNLGRFPQEIFWDHKEILSFLWEQVKALHPERFETRWKNWKESQGIFKEKLRRKLAGEYYGVWGAGVYLDALLLKLRDRAVAIIEEGPEDRERIEIEYERGSLYWFSRQQVEALPRSLPEMGFLFADFRGFTSLTLRAKEVETATFLSQEFFQPLLAILAEEVSGLSGRWEESPIRINNLMGDALSASGDLTALIFGAERMKLLIEDRREELMRRVQDGRYRSLLAQVDCGIYIGFGTAPFEVVVPSPFGQFKVAIAEKINETARGVSRDGDVYALIEEVLRKKEGGEWLFRVYIAPVLSGKILQPMDLWPRSPEDLETALRSGLIRVQWEGKMGLYNIGIAISGEALSALLRIHSVTSGSFLKVATPLLMKDLPGRCAVEPETDLYLFHIRQRPCLVRRVGKLLFKGFEGMKPMLICEWIPSGDPAFPLLVEKVSQQGKRENPQGWLSR